MRSLKIAGRSGQASTPLALRQALSVQESPDCPLCLLKDWEAVSRVLMLLLTLLLASVTRGNAQEVRPGIATQQEPATTPLQQLTAEQIAELRRQAETAELDEAVRKEVLNLYDRAVSELGRATRLSQAAEQDKQRVSGAESEGSRLQAEIDGIPGQVEQSLGQGLSLDALETEILTRTPRLQELKKELTDLQALTDSENKRRDDLAKAQTTLPSRLQVPRKVLAEAPPDGENPMLSNARRLAAQAEILALEAEGPAIAAELARLTAERTAEIARRKTELKQRQISLMEAEIRHLRQLQNVVRARQAREVGLGAIPPNSALGREAQTWLTRVQELVTLIPDAGRKESERARLREDIEAKEKRIQARVRQLGIIVPVGIELRNALNSLPDIRDIEEAISGREVELAELNNQRLQHEERLQTLEASLVADTTRPDADIRKSQIAILKTLAESERAYLEAARKLDTEARLLVQAHQRFEAWLRERVLWIRSNELIGLGDISQARETLGWLLSPSNWMTVPDALVADARAKLVTYYAVIVLFVVLTFTQRKYRKELLAIGRDARRMVCTRFKPTVRAIWLTLLISVTWPLALGFIGHRLREPPHGSDFSQALGAGLEAVAFVYLLLNLLRQVCRNDGLGEAHFVWDDATVKVVHTRLRLIMFAVLPLLFIAAMVHSGRSAPGGDSLERICFIIALALIGFSAYQIAHPKTGVFAAALRDDTAGWSNRTKWIWFPLFFGMPVALAVLATIGYYFTAYELAWRLGVMAWLIVGLVILQAMLVRWQAVNQRRIRMEQARQRRQAMLQQEGDSETAPVPEERDELDTISSQTLRLINTGLLLVGLVATWLLWSGVLPAVSFLDEWTLWKTSREVSVERVVEGTAKFVTETRIEPITALSLLGALFLVIVTFTAARNLPGLLEIVLLQHLPLEPALRYAVRTVARYLIVIVGVTLTCSTLGIGWDKVQWLVAGLTVGLGFGLQEIFANFVSGLIILFERPVRIGDIVTIDGVTGTVSRIQIRATTVTDWDRKEYIVPNKELVTGRLLNWTLSDKTNRILIEVGVAYGSDTKKARELLLQVARQHPAILEDPSPVATFEKFGDSTLLLILRCFLPNFDNRLQVITELHDAIDEAFRAADIEIAFPQLDLHVRDQPTPVEDA